MTIHFAAARSPLGTPVARLLIYRAPRQPANDNGAATSDRDVLLKAALQHFSKHGLGAAKAAREQAESARRTGDDDGYEWWLSICRTLDHRLADRCVRAIHTA